MTGPDGLTDDVTTTLEHDETAHQYRLVHDGETVSIADYRPLDDGTLVFHHTLTPPLIAATATPPTSWAGPSPTSAPVGTRSWRRAGSSILACTPSSTTSAPSPSASC